MGQRQRESVQAMAEAFRRNYNNHTLEATPHMDEAALQCELHFTLELDADISKVGMYETAIMATQRWKITALPMNIIEQVIQVALLYRNALKDSLPLVKTQIPNPQLIFAQMLPDATEETRPDILVLLGALLSESEHINCYVYSEPDRLIVAAWRGFERLQSTKGPLQELPLSASASEIIAYGQYKAGMVDLTVCYWCEKNGMSCNLKVCQQCRAVSYCSVDCQTLDWKAFHKHECKLLQSHTPQELGITTTRLAYLQQLGVPRAKFPFPLAAHQDDLTSVWRGDLMLLYLINPKNGTTLGEKTTGFPRGLHMHPREIQQR